LEFSTEGHLVTKIGQMLVNNGERKVQIP
jgi:hypothetical protein